MTDAEAATKIGALDTRIAKLEAMIGRMRIVGPGFSGGPTTGWAFNPPETKIEVEAECVPDSDPPIIRITATAS